MTDEDRDLIDATERTPWLEPGELPPPPAELAMPDADEPQAAMPQLAPLRPRPRATLPPPIPGRARAGTVPPPVPAVAAPPAQASSAMPVPRAAGPATSAPPPIPMRARATSVPPPIPVRARATTSVPVPARGSASVVVAPALDEPGFDIDFTPTSREASESPRRREAAAPSFAMPSVAAPSLAPSDAPTFASGGEPHDAASALESHVAPYGDDSAVAYVAPPAPHAAVIVEPDLAESVDEHESILARFQPPPEDLAQDDDSVRAGFAPHAPTFLEPDLAEAAPSNFAPDLAGSGWVDDSVVARNAPPAAAPESPAAPDIALPAFAAQALAQRHAPPPPFSAHAPRSALPAPAGGVPFAPNPAPAHNATSAAPAGWPVARRDQSREIARAEDAFWRSGDDDNIDWRDGLDGTGSNVDLEELEPPRRRPPIVRWALAAACVGAIAGLAFVVTRKHQQRDDRPQVAERAATNANPSAAPAATTPAVPAATPPAAPAATPSAVAASAAAPAGETDAPPAPVAAGTQVPAAAIAADTQSARTDQQIAPARPVAAAPSRSKRHEKTAPTRVAKTSPARSKGAARERSAAGATGRSRVAANTSGHGTLMVSSKPPCEIAIDGVATVLMTPQRALKLKPGRHKVTLFNLELGIDATIDVVIEPNRPTKIIRDFTSQIARSARRTR